MLTFTLAAALAATQPAAATPDPDIEARVSRVLAQTPMIDGHNDLPYALARAADGAVDDIEAGTPFMTDLERLREGQVGAQMWSVYIPAATTGDEAIRTTIEQIDIVDRMVRSYPHTLGWAHDASELVEVFADGRIAAMAGIEGGHQIGGNLAALRQFKRLGAIYMTLTHSRTTGWADSATDDPVHGGLSDFGRTVIAEMNRIGMLVDLSHVTAEAMHDVLDVTRAPVIFSHSSARGVTDHVRNVPDDVLARLPGNGGVVMVTFVPQFVSAEVKAWSEARSAEQERLEALYPPIDGEPRPEARAAWEAWQEANPAPKATLADVADHIDHVARVAGHDHIGIGGDFDGISMTVEGLDSVDDYPDLLAELARRGWSDDNLAKLAGGNVLRVMLEAEMVAAAMRDAPPALDKAPLAD
ncbi:dipeptidase [Sphingomicrobium astaxanthinifaciens]|uniref:dipeptidase n=1 Tax=Sphingomicrobium astaxanthinifaciens TaxID=1227949 RepID=UPI001FCAF720|nr:dipeptidase [Sphingomicrobium astaxanthinifaciens]MCJ7420911.1 dipeptidase [Sphingomicrobium astaxanthinifaciens]